MYLRTPGLVFVLALGTLVLGGCSSGFWYRNGCVAGERQVAQITPCSPQPAPQCCPQPAPRACPPACPPSSMPRSTVAAPLAPRGMTAPPVTPPGGSASGPASSEEMEVLAYVNTIRRQQNLRPLNFHPDLWIAARDHSAEQQRHGYMGHESPDPQRKRLSQRMGQAGYQGRVYAEVVAWGYPDTRSVVDGWMNSPDHRRILIDPELSEAGFSRIGSYWTGNFGAPSRHARAAPLDQRTARPPAASIPRAQPLPARPQSARPVPAPTPRVAPVPHPTPAPRTRAPVSLPQLPFRVGGG